MRFEKIQHLFTDDENIRKIHDELGLSNPTIKCLQFDVLNSDLERFSIDSISKDVKEKFENHFG